METIASTLDQLNYWATVNRKRRSHWEVCACVVRVWVGVVPYLVLVCCYMSRGMYLSTNTHVCTSTHCKNPLWAKPNSRSKRNVKPKWGRRVGVDLSVSTLCTSLGQVLNKVYCIPVLIRYKITYVYFYCFLFTILRRFRDLGEKKYTISEIKIFKKSLV